MIKNKQNAGPITLAYAAASNWRAAGIAPVITRTTRIAMRTSIMTVDVIAITVRGEIRGAKQVMTCCHARRGPMEGAQHRLLRLPLGPRRFPLELFQTDRGRAAYQPANAEIATTGMARTLAKITPTGHR